MFLSTKKEAEQGFEKLTWGYHLNNRASLGYVEKKNALKTKQNSPISLSYIIHPCFCLFFFMFEIGVLLCSPV